MPLAGWHHSLSIVQEVWDWETLTHFGGPAGLGHPYLWSQQSVELSSV